jgi:hypothetical protein
MTEDTLVLYDEQIYYAFIGKIKEQAIISSTPSAPMQSDNSGAFMRFESSNNYKTYTRIDYTILQLLGDVGALYQALHDIFSFILNYIFRF